MDGKSLCIGRAGTPLRASAAGTVFGVATISGRDPASPSTPLRGRASDDWCVRRVCVEDVVVNAPLVLDRIDGPSRELVFDQTARFFRVVAAKDRRPLVIAATLLSPGRGCRDGWTITVNADVSFAPTGLGADCPISSIIGQPSEELSDTADELSDTAADG
jgi:hypothetical protein